ncbi:adenosylcobinamide-GDP ribazoletransferase, partial [Rhizobium leguminosarum]
ARHSSPLTAALAIPDVAALSRGAIAWHWQRLAPAKADGVAASTSQPDEAAMQFALASASLVAALLIWPAFGLWPLIT